MMRRVYLDNNATTPVLPEVLEAMRPYFGEHFGNASSIHHHGQETRAAVERARESVAALLGCRSSEVVFTSGGTEGDNLAVFGVMKHGVRNHGVAQSGDHLITSTIEHHAVLNACKHLANYRETTGCEVTYIPVDGRGLVDPADVKRALRPNTKLITIMFANNETGVLQPVAEIGKIAAEADVYFHTDAVQAAGKIRIDVDQIGCDLLTISGHRFGAGLVQDQEEELCVAHDGDRASFDGQRGARRVERSGHRRFRQGRGVSRRGLRTRRRPEDGGCARLSGEGTARDRSHGGER